MQAGATTVPVGRLNIIFVRDKVCVSRGGTYSSMNEEQERGPGAGRNMKGDISPCYL